MSEFLLDTNIPSETLRLVPDSRVIMWLETQSRSAQFISVATVGELRRGATLLPPSARRTQLEHFIEVTLPAWFESRILPVTQSIAEQWGALDGKRQLSGRPINIADGLIAATALGHDLTLVTRKTKDFADLQLNLLNSWEI